MPRLDAADLCFALRRLAPDEFDEVLLTRLIPATALPDLRLVIACGEQALADAKVQGLQLAAYASTADFMAAVRAVRGRRLLDLATFGLARRMPQLSASRRITLGQGLAVLTFLAAAIALGLILPAAASWSLASALAGLFFLGVVALRILALLPGPVRQPVIRRSAAEWQLPTYSVLVPLFRETAVLPQLIGALSAIDYPALCRKRTKTATRLRGIKGPVIFQIFGLLNARLQSAPSSEHPRFQAPRDRGPHRKP